MKNVISFIKLLFTPPKTASDAGGLVVVWFILILLGTAIELGAERVVELFHDRQVQLQQKELSK